MEISQVFKEAIFIFVWPTLSHKRTASEADLKVVQANGGECSQNIWWQYNDELFDNAPLTLHHF